MNKQIVSAAAVSCKAKTSYIIFLQLGIQNVQQILIGRNNHRTRLIYEHSFRSNGVNCPLLLISLHNL